MLKFPSLIWGFNGWCRWGGDLVGERSRRLSAGYCSRVLMSRIGISYLWRPCSSPYPHGTLGSRVIFICICTYHFALESTYGLRGLRYPRDFDLSSYPILDRWVHWNSCGLFQVVSASALGEIKSLVGRGTWWRLSCSGSPWRVPYVLEQHKRLRWLIQL